MSTTTIILWIGTAIMTLGLLAFLGLTLKAPTQNRSFFTITSLIALIAATAYFAMVTGYGSIMVGGRTFYFARYIDWVVTTPLLLLDLSLLALPTLSGNWNRIGAMIAADVYMIITGLVAGLINSNFKYVWFIASTIAFIVVLYNLLGYLFPLAAARGGEVKQLFNTLSILTAVLWICYPIVWLLGTEGIRLFSLPLEVGLFAVLDVLAKVGFGFVLLTSGVVLGREATRRRAIPAM